MKASAVSVLNFTEPLLSERQSAVFEFLKLEAGEVAKVFEAGARLRNDDSFPARPYFVAHAAREILNRLPDYYRGELRTVEDRKRPRALKDLAAAWYPAVRSQFAVLREAGLSAEVGSVSIPLDLAKRLNALVNYEVGTAKYVRLRFADFLSRLQNVFPEQVLEIAESFLVIDAHARAHVPKPDDLWDEAIGIDVWDQLEERLFALVGPRHEIYANISDLVTELNAL